ncbi:hypothetical protein Tco_0717420 [Tanacetum coccineum]
MLFKEEGIENQTSTPRTPKQNELSKDGTDTLVEAALNNALSFNFHYLFGLSCCRIRDSISKGYRVYNKRTYLIVESIHIKFDEIKEMMSDHNSSDLAPQRQEMSVENVSSCLVPQGQKASDYDNSDPVPPRQNVIPTAEKTDSSQQGLEFLFSPLLEEYYNPAHGHAEDNNNDQAPNASFQEAEFINPFCTRVQEIGESSSRNIDNTDVHSFQPQSHDYRWTRDHPLEQVRGNPTMPPNVLVAKGFAQEEGIDFEESFEHSARLDSRGGFMLHQLEGKGSLIQFTRKKFSTSVESWYGLKASSTRAWYDELQTFLQPDLCRMHLILAKRLLRGIQFLGDKLVSLVVNETKMHCKSSAEQSSWRILQVVPSSNVVEDTAQDYGFNYNKIPLYCRL